MSATRSQIKQFALFALTAVAIVAAVSCAGVTTTSQPEAEIVTIRCPNVKTGIAMTVTVPPLEADADGWIPPDETLRYEAAVMFYLDVEKMGCRQSWMENKDRMIKGYMDDLKEAATICDLDIIEIIQRVNSEVEARQAAITHIDPGVHELPMRGTLLMMAIFDGAQFCPWYEG